MLDDKGTTHYVTLSTTRMSEVVHRKDKVMITTGTQLDTSQGVGSMRTVFQIEEQGVVVTLHNVENVVVLQLACNPFPSTAIPEHGHENITATANGVTLFSGKLNFTRSAG